MHYTLAEVEVEVCYKMADRILAGHRAIGFDLLSFVAWMAEETLEGEADTLDPEDLNSRTPKLAEHTEHTEAVATPTTYTADYCLEDGSNSVAVDKEDPWFMEVVPGTRREGVLLESSVSRLSGQGNVKKGEKLTEGAPG